MAPGGLGAAAAPDAAEKALIEGAKALVEAKTGATYTTFEAVSVCKQVVAGTNYFAKIHVGDGAHVHARLFRGLGAAAEVSCHSVQTGKTADDAIEYFQE